MKNSIDFSPNGKNRTPDIVKALLHAPDDTVISFEEGVYDFYTEGSYKGYFFPGCNRNGEKKVIFPILNSNNLTIKGNGAKFLFHDRVFPFILQNCSNVSLHNFSIDFSFPRCLEATVTKMNDEGFALTISGEDYNVNEYGNLLIQAGSETFSSSERRFFLEQRDWHCFISVGDIYYENINAPADVIYCNAEKHGNEIFFKYRENSVKVKFTLNKRLMLSYDELRENDVFFMDRCQNTEIENIHILHGAGMGIVGQCCENLKLDHYTVDPMDDGLYSTTADAILLTNFSGKVQIENTHIDRSIDDAISIHGFYSVVDRVTDRNKAIARLVHPSQAGANIYFKGDVLRVSDGVSLNSYATVTVKEAYIREETACILLEFEEDIFGKLKVGDILENPNRTPEVEIRNCEFMNFPTIRLASAQKTVFENNIVKNCIAVKINDLMRYWYASGCVTDLQIKHNLFENIDTALDIFVQRLPDSNVRHKNIVITENIFRNCRQAIVADCVDTLIIRDNIFEGVSQPVKITNCTDVTCQAEATMPGIIRNTSLQSNGV